VNESRSLAACVRGRCCVAAVGAALALLGPLPLAESARLVDGGYSRQTAYSSGDADIDRLQDYFAQALEANGKEFEGRTGTVRGFGAGDVYPQIWLRDSATLIPLARYLFPRERLTSWLEEHLAHQTPDGALFDWIASGAPERFRQWAPNVRQVYRSGALQISADKNTTESDQEPSAVAGVYQSFRVTGDEAWLRKPILGTTLLERCDRALLYLLQHRLDPRLGLVTSALTADWGDVSPTYSDQRSIYRDARTPVVASLYANALFHAAALRLAELHDAAGGRIRAAFWRTKAQTIQARLAARLWDEKQGFFRMHALLTPDLAPAYPGDGIFALGGNALAVLSGAASDEQARRIFETAERRCREHGVSTIAAVLLPPFPDGFFKHPAVSGQWQYQNGGQWDWFAGRLILAEYERGHSERATAQLSQIARRAVQAGGLFEWNSRTGEGRGSSRYAGSAGALAEAVFRGLYGVELVGKTLSLRVRLRDKPGDIHLYQPATDTYVAYRYLPAPRRGVLAIRYESNAQPGRLAVALPAGTRVTGATRDGRETPVATEARGNDRFACLDTDWKPHRLEIGIEQVGARGSRLQ